MTIPPTTEVPTIKIAELSGAPVTIANADVVGTEKFQTEASEQDLKIQILTLDQQQWAAIERRFAQQDTMIKAMIWMFGVLNGSVMLFVGIAWAAGFWSKPEIITEKVILGLIGATIIQAGIAFITITKFLFPSRGDDIAIRKSDKKPRAKVKSKSKNSDE